MLPFRRSTHAPQFNRPVPTVREPFPETAVMKKINRKKCWACRHAAQQAGVFPDDGHVRYSALLGVARGCTIGALLSAEIAWQRCTGRRGDASPASPFWIVSDSGVSGAPGHGTWQGTLLRDLPGMNVWNWRAPPKIQAANS